MPHPLVLQLRFTRSEFQRALEGLSDADARKRLLPMNCISWNVGHMAWQEQCYWLLYGQDQLPLANIHDQFACGAPSRTPALEDMLDAWHTITRMTDQWLDTLTAKKLQEHVIIDGQTSPYIFGSALQRVIYHYWYHTGENMAIRKLLGHTNLPQFVGDIDSEAPYRPE